MKKILLSISLFCLALATNAQNSWELNFEDPENASLYKIKDFQFLPGFAWNWSYYSGSYNRIYSSTDGGQNWNLYHAVTAFPGGTAYESPLKMHYFDDLNAVYLYSYITPSFGYRFYKTTDGGATFTAIADVSIPDFNSSIINNAYPNIPQIQFVTEDFWVFHARGVTKISDPNNGYSAICTTTDGGETWNAVTPLASGSYFDDVFFASTTVGYAVTGNAILKTTDGGANWNALATNAFEGASASLSSGKFFFLDDDKGYFLRIGNVGLSIDQLLYTTDGGTTFTEKNLSSDDLWTDYQYNSSDEPVGRVYGFNFSDINNGTITAVHNQSFYQIIRTTDGGDTWVADSIGSSVTLSDGYGVINCQTVNSNSAFGLYKDKLVGFGNGTVTPNGIEESKLISNVKLYPNPATDVLHLEDFAPNSTYEIYNVLGELVQYGTIRNQSINIGKLEAGSYVITINQNTQKFIKQ